jgi:ketosteroid isomerase-like protein
MASSAERERRARAGFEAFNAGDHRAVVELLCDDVEVFASPELANSGRFHGRDGYRTWIEPWIDAWDAIDMEIAELTPVGERHVVAEVHQVGHGREGIEVSMDVAFLFDIGDDGLVSYLALHPDREGAFADARERETLSPR